MAVVYGMCGGAEENTKPVEAEVDLAEPRRTMSSTLDVVRVARKQSPTKPRARSAGRYAYDARSPTYAIPTIIRLRTKDQGTYAD